MKEYYCCPVDTRKGYYVGFSRDRVYIVGLVGHSVVLGAPSAGVRAPTANFSTEVRLWLICRARNILRAFPRLVDHGPFRAHLWVTARLLKFSTPWLGNCHRVFLDPNSLVLPCMAIDALNARALWVVQAADQIYRDVVGDMTIFD